MHSVVCSPASFSIPLCLLVWTALERRSPKSGMQEVGAFEYMYLTSAIIISGVYI